MVPTKDRPDDLRRLFKSILDQTRAPDEVIIVDGSDHPIKDVLDEFPTLPFTYIPVRPPSLPKQRNVGINSLTEDVDWAGFLDDDLVLMDTALEKIEQFIGASDDGLLRGVGLKIVNQPHAKAGLYNRAFLLSNQSGKMTRSGFASEIPAVGASIEVDWIYGGATFRRTDVFSEFSFDEWFKGTGYLEDVDFSYGVSRKYKLKVCAEAECLHLSHPIRRSKQKAIGEWQITSWWYFICKYKDFSKALVLWAMFGMLSRNILGAILTGSIDRLLRSFGNCSGIYRVFSGTALNATGFSK